MTEEDEKDKAVDDLLTRLGEELRKEELSFIKRLQREFDDFLAWIAEKTQISIGKLKKVAKSIWQILRGS